MYSVTSLNNNPQIGGSSVTKVTTAGTTGVFTIDVSTLPTGTQISYAAYATNIAGTSYTTVGTFTTQPAIGQFPGITVQILNGQMIVTGTEQDDTIKVASDGMGGYIVTANKKHQRLAIAASVHRRRVDRRQHARRQRRSVARRAADTR